MDRRMLPTHKNRIVWLWVLLVATCAVAGCTSGSAGNPIARVDSTGSETSGSTTTSAPTSSSAANGKALKELDMCRLLTPGDMPVQPGASGTATQKPKYDGDLCSTTVQLADILSVLVSTIERHFQPFSQFVPPSSSKNGKMTEVAGRNAWVGNPFSDVDKGCVAVFGASDGYISLSVTDETNRGVDPCQTVTQLAEKVVSRTPAPRG